MSEGQTRRPNPAGHRFVAALVLAGLAALGALGERLAGSFDGEARALTFATKSGRKLAGTLATPPRNILLRGVVLLHGSGTDRTAFEPLARELARRGLAALALDRGGVGDSEPSPGGADADREDLVAAFDLLRTEGAVGPLAVVAHGSAAAIPIALANEAQDPRCVVILGGLATGATKERPPWLLAAVGAMDGVCSPGEVAASLEPVTLDPRPGVTRVDPASGAVRRLVVSGGCEHAGVLWDARVAGEVARFVGASLAPDGKAPEGDEAGAAARPAVQAFLHFLGSAGACGGLAVLLLAVARALGERPGESHPLIGRALAAGGLALALAPSLAATQGIVGAGTARTWTPPLLLGALTATALLSARLRLGVLAAVLVGWIAGTTITAAAVFQREPSLLASLPLYLVQGPAFRLSLSLDSLGGLLVSGTGEATRPALPLLGLVALDLLSPGAALGAFGWLLLKVFRSLGGPARPSEDEAGRGAGEAGAATHPDDAARGVATGERGASPDPGAEARARGRAGASVLRLAIVVVSVLIALWLGPSWGGPIGRIVLLGIRLAGPTVIAGAIAARLVR